jgi:hypothetical protein
MKDIKITSNELLAMNCSLLPLKAKDFSDYSFWYYTSVKTANLILQNKCIHISNLTNMNDVDESKLHNEEKDFVHCLCLCNSNTEKIPMWYLYSGITGKGVALGLTPSVMLELIRSIDTVTNVEGDVILKRDKDFILDCGWIFYRKRDNTSKVMFKRKWYSLTDPDMFEKDNYFIKSYPWEYEKEFRIVIHNKTKIPYDKLVINIEDIYKKLKIKLAPEIFNDLSNDLLPELDVLTSLSLKSVHKSNLGINMNLCKRNFDCFLDYITMDLRKAEEDRVVDVNKIYSVIESVL